MSYLMEQLDDWVLCRVRQKANTTRNLQKVHDPPKPETMRHLMQVEDSTPAANGMVFKDQMYKYCPVLKSLLTGQPLPANVSNQCASPQEIYNSCSSVYEDGSCSDTSPMTVSSFDNFFSPPYVREVQEIQNGVLLQSKTTGNGYTFFDASRMLGYESMDLCSDYGADIFTPSPSSVEMTTESLLLDGYLK